MTMTSFCFWVDRASIPAVRLASINDRTFRNELFNHSSLLPFLIFSLFVFFWTLWQLCNLSILLSLSPMVPSSNKKQKQQASSRTFCPTWRFRKILHPWRPTTLLQPMSSRNIIKGRIVIEDLYVRTHFALVITYGLSKFLDIEGLVKHEAIGSLDHYKTLLVAKGYNQQEGIGHIEYLALLSK